MLLQRDYNGVMCYCEGSRWQGLRNYSTIYPLMQKYKMILCTIKYQFSIREVIRHQKSGSGKYILCYKIIHRTLHDAMPRSTYSNWLTAQEFKFATCEILIFRVMNASCFSSFNKCLQIVERNKILNFEKNNGPQFIVLQQLYLYY